MTSMLVSVQSMKGYEKEKLSQIWSGLAPFCMMSFTALFLINCLSNFLINFNGIKTCSEKSVTHLAS